MGFLSQAWPLGSLTRTSPVPFRGSCFTVGLHPLDATPQWLIPCLIQGMEFSTYCIITLRGGAGDRGSPIARCGSFWPAHLRYVSLRCAQGAVAGSHIHRWADPLNPDLGKTSLTLVGHDAGSCPDSAGASGILGGVSSQPARRRRSFLSAALPPGHARCAPARLHRLLRGSP
jgi:hypothetical protein